MGKTFRRDDEVRNKDSKSKNKKLSKLNKPYLNKGGKVRNYLEEYNEE